jgi:hypothetical protein
MTPEEILRKFVIARMMVKEVKYIDDIASGPLPLYEPQPIALKATNSKDALLNKVAQVEAIGLNEEEMVLVIKRFMTALNGRKEYPNKNKLRGKHSCFKCGLVTLLHNVLIMRMTRDKKTEGRRGRKRIIRRQRERLTSVRSGTQTALHPTPTMRDMLLPPSTSPPSSPMSDIIASWLRRRRYIQKILLSTLLLVTRISMMS